MKMLYAPWRENYTTDDARGPKGEDKTPDDLCIFCDQLKQHKDDEYFILARYKHTYIILNRYPYNAGHLLILPLAHEDKLEQLSTQTRAELMELISKSSRILEQELGAKGINVGLNMGKAAGAGLPSHLHFHVLPRWIGDTNFLPTLGKVKTVSIDIETVFKKLKPHFKKLK